LEERANLTLPDNGGPKQLQSGRYGILPAVEHRRFP
jgi:hypothetical protein